VSIRNPILRSVSSAANWGIGCFGERSNHGINPLLHRMTLAVARMRHHVSGADESRAFDLATESRSRLYAQRLAARSEVDEVIVVDD
jgi:hypothetical protein